MPVDGVVVIGLRLITGICMAGIYPIGMKMVATWSRGDTGFLVGLLVGALTMGSALPHLFAVAVPLDWRMVIVAASISAYIAGVAILFVKLGGTPGKSRALIRVWSGTSGRTNHCVMRAMAISGICGNFMPCGAGSGCSCMGPFRA